MLGLFLASNKAFAYEPSVLKAQGQDVVINYPYPVQNILPGKAISFTASYTGLTNPQGMDWMGSVCGKFVFLKNVGKTATFNNIRMPKVGTSCLISLTPGFDNTSSFGVAGAINHKLEFANPTFVFGTNPSSYSEKYYVQSSVPTVPLVNSFSYWKWRITGCDKGSTASQNTSTSRMNFSTNGQVCNISMSLLARYDDTIQNSWLNNKFVIYSKTISHKQAN